MNTIKFNIIQLNTPDKVKKYIAELFGLPAEHRRMGQGIKEFSDAHKLLDPNPLQVFSLTCDDSIHGANHLQSPKEFFRETLLSLLLLVTCLYFLIVNVNCYFSIYFT